MDASRSGTKLKQISQKSFYILKKPLEKKREIFCILGTINGPGYTTTELKTVYNALFVNTQTIITC